MSSLPSLAELSQRVHASPGSTALRESEIVFPLLLVVHVLGLVLLVGPIFVVDLRLLGRVFRAQPVLLFIRPLLRVAWLGFAVLAGSGVPLLLAQAGRLHANPFLRAKFVLLVMAGLNAWLFHRLVARRIEGWAAAEVLPAGARVAASVSLTSWAALVVVSRLIPLFDHP